MHKFLISFILSLFFLPVSAQEYEVVSFEIKPNDLTARRSPRIDFNGKKCALIKVYTSDNISEVRGNIIGEIESSGMEKWIYVEDGTKQLEIVFDNHYPLSLVFENYDYPVLTQQMTYILKLKDISTSQVAADSEGSTATGLLAVSQEDVLERMRKAYNTNDYKKTLELAFEIKDNPEAQEMIGSLYDDGLGVEADDEEAKKWYLKAAEGGNIQAMVNLGVLYYDVEVDCEEALKWLQKAANLGNVIAVRNIGVLYEYDNCFPQSYTEAMKWYRKAADLGDAEAMYYIGLLYYNGYGVPQNISEAKEWFLKAADLENTKAMIKIGTTYFYGIGVPNDNSEAMKWFKKAADLGDTEAKDIFVMLERHMK